MNRKLFVLNLSSTAITSIRVNKETDTESFTICGAIATPTTANILSALAAGNTGSPKFLIGVAAEAVLGGNLVVLDSRAASSVVSVTVIQGGTTVVLPMIDEVYTDPMLAVNSSLSALLAAYSSAV